MVMAAKFISKLKKSQANTENITIFHVELFTELLKVARLGQVRLRLAFTKFYRFFFQECNFLW